MRKTAEQICEIGRRMYARELVASHDGNISVRLAEGRVMVTPTMTSKGFMSPDDMVVTDMDGNILEGRNKASSELMMHLAIYKNRRDVNAIVHAHPVTATAFAIIGRPIDVHYMPEAVMSLGVIPIAPYGRPSTREVPDSVVQYVAGHNGVLLSNHGAVTWGADLVHAYNLMEQLEFCCRIIIIAEQIGKPRNIPN